MTKPKHTMVPRRAAVMLALLASASNQTLLAALTVGSLNTALLSSASAATCVTSVSPTFANVIGDVTGAAGQTVVTSVTPTFNNAVTGVTAPTQPVVTGVTAPTAPNFLTSGTTVTTTAAPALTSVTTTPGNAIAFGSLPTGTVTGITPTPGAPPNLIAPAFAPNFPNATANLPPTPAIGVANIFTTGAVTGFALQNSGSTTASNSGTIVLTTSAPGAANPVWLLNVPIVSGTLASPQTVVTGQGTSLGS